MTLLDQIPSAVKKIKKPGVGFLSLQIENDLLNFLKKEAHKRSMSRGTLVRMLLIQATGYEEK